VRRGEKWGRGLLAYPSRNEAYKAGGDKERACDECVRQKRFCGRTVGSHANGEGNIKGKEAQQVKEYQLIFYPFTEALREGVSWDDIAFWIRSR
jgi:hypothetical protein